MKCPECGTPCRELSQLYCEQCGADLKIVGLPIDPFWDSPEQRVKAIRHARKVGIKFEVHRNFLRKFLRAKAAGKSLSIWAKENEEFDGAPTESQA